MTSGSTRYDFRVEVLEENLTASYSSSSIDPQSFLILNRSSIIPHPLSILNHSSSSIIPHPQSILNHSSSSIDPQSMNNEHHISTQHGNPLGRFCASTHQSSIAAVLNLFRLADHQTNFVSVRGPPNKFPHFPGKISDHHFLVISLKNYLGSRTTQKFQHFPGNKFGLPLLVIFPNSLNFSG